MSSTNAKDQEHILVVDDDEVNREIMGEILAEHYTLSFAESGEEALAKAGQLRPGLVLLDIMMPGINGYEVCRQLRACKELRHSKVILVSAKAMLSERIQGYDAGADDYITKPFDASELLAKVKVFLRLRNIEEVDELKSNILNRLRHETRTPLTAVLAATQLLVEEDGVDGAEQRRWMTIAHKNAKRLHSLLEKGTLLCSYKSGAVVLRMEEFNLRLMLERVLKEHYSSIQAKNLRLAYVAGEDTWICGHEEHLRLVAEALVENAIQYSPAEGELTVWVGRREENGVLTVTDQGRGIEREDLSHVFDGLDTGDVDHHSRGGGLNLALGRAVVQYHGGQIEVESQPGVRTTFRVELPLAESACVVKAGEA